MALRYLDNARQTIFSCFSFATELCNIEVVDFIRDEKWLQKGLILQHDSNLALTP